MTTSTPSLFAPSVHQGPVPQPQPLGTAPLPPPSPVPLPHVVPPPAPVIDPGLAPLTEEQFRAALPDKVKKSVHSSLITAVNQTLKDPDFYEHYRDNLLGYGRVMQDGRFTLEQYIAAVKYVSYKLMGDTNIEAYSKTFPDKVTRFQSQGVAAKDIASYVTAYNKSKLVSLLFEQTLIPSYILNQDLYQKAINTQAELMVSAKSEKVRTDAANSLLTHLKPPEVQKIEMQIGVKEDSAITALRESTAELVRQQRLMLESRQVDARTVAQTPVKRLLSDRAEDAVEVSR